MKSAILIILLSVLLASCSPPTDIEIEQHKKLCEISGKQLIIDAGSNYHMWCKEKDNPVMDCIKEYTNWLDEKYNNPDTVTDLREDNYSQVVKSCNEVFGNK